MEYIVIKEFKTDNQNPIILKKGEKIIIGEEYNGNEDWSNWIYCKKIDKSNEGWVPKQIIKYINNYGIITEDYSAKEMDVEKGIILECIKELNGWIWSKNKRTNETGWVPLNKVEKK
jgi:hypothetical protein